MYVYVPCMEDVNESEKIRYTAMATGLQLLVPLAEQQGDQVGEKLQLPPPSWRF